MEIIKIKSCPEFVAQDQAIVREIVSPQNSSVKNQSLAEVTIPSGSSILEHYHIKTEELYYVISGEGQMCVEGELRTIGTGGAVVILPGQRHKVSNIGRIDLVMLVACAPAYQDEDQVIV